MSLDCLWAGKDCLVLVGLSGLTSDCPVLVGLSGLTLDCLWAVSGLYIVVYCTEWCTVQSVLYRVVYCTDCILQSGVHIV